jgi:hypothetical protein
MNFNFNIKSFLLNESDKDFFLTKARFIYFVIAILMFYNLSITAHNNLGKNYLSFAAMNMFVLVITFVLSTIKQMRIWMIFALYNAFYVLFTITGLFDFDIIYLGILNFTVYIIIKSYDGIIVNNKNEQIIGIMDYAITDDFDSNMAYHNYAIPFEKTNEKQRNIQEELEILDKYNDMLNYKNKIAKENFERYNGIHFLIPKSILLIIYQTILNYNRQGITSVKTTPISFKLTDESENPKYNRGAYVFEFKFDRTNLRNIRTDKKIMSIKNGIDEIITVCKQNKMDLKIAHGVNKNNYIVRIQFNINKEKNSEVVKLVKQISNNKDEQFKDINLSMSDSNMTTQYSDSSDVI